MTREALRCAHSTTFSEPLHADLAILLAGIGGWLRYDLITA